MSLLSRQLQRGTIRGRGMVVVGVNKKVPGEVEGTGVYKNGVASCF
jgi:hypothetical protein